MYSLYALPAHDVQHLLGAALVETSPRVTLADVRLDVERRGRQAGVDLLRECRDGLVVRGDGTTVPAEERPHGVEERSSVPERHYPPSASAVMSLKASAEDGRDDVHITSNVERANTDNQKNILSGRALCESVAGARRVWRPAAPIGPDQIIYPQATCIPRSVRKPPAQLSPSFLPSFASVRKVNRVARTSPEC